MSDKTTKPDWWAHPSDQCGAQRPASGLPCVRHRGHVGHHMTLKGNGFDLPPTTAPASRRRCDLCGGNEFENVTVAHSRCVASSVTDAVAAERARIRAGVEAIFVRKRNAFGDSFEADVLALIDGGETRGGDDA